MWWCTQKGCGSSTRLPTWLSLCTSSIWLFILPFIISLINKLGNVSVSLNSVISSGKLNLKRWAWKLQFISRLVRSTSHNLGLVIGIWSRLQSWRRETEPLACEIWCYVQVNSQGIKLNYRTPSWCVLENCMVCGEKTTYIWSQAFCAVFSVWEQEKHFDFFPISISVNVSDLQAFWIVPISKNNLGDTLKLFSCRNCS